MSLDQALNELKYGGPELRTRAALALGELKNPSVIPYLIQSLSDPEGEVRAAAAQALIEYRDPSSVAPLIKLLNDRYWPVRKAASITLGLIGDQNALKPLLKLAEYGWRNSPNSDAQHKTTIQTTIALGRLKAEKATEQLTKILKKGYTNAPSDWQLQLRQAAALALGFMDNLTAAEALVDVLREHEPGPVRRSATTALGLMQNEKSFRFMLENMTFRPFENTADVWRRQEGIITALGERRDRRAVPYILPMVYSEYAEVRVALARTLVQLGEDQQAEALLQLLRDRMPEVRAAAAQALGELNVLEAADALNVVLQDPNRQVAGAAAVALEAIKQLPSGATDGRFLPSGNNNSEED